jgi:hypothetical protein
MRRGAILLLLALAAYGTVWTQRVPTAVYRSAHVTLRAPRAGDPGRIVNDLERAYRRVREFGLPVPGRISAICYATTAEFMRGSGARAHHLAMARGAVIHLQPASVLLRRGGERGMIHEMTHVALLPAAGSGLPRWLNEGIAMTVAGEKLPGSDTCRSLTALDRALDGSHGYAASRSAYGTAERLTARLLAAAGRARLLDLLRRVAAGEKFEGLFEKLVGMGPEAWGARMLRR